MSQENQNNNEEINKIVENNEKPKYSAIFELNLKLKDKLINYAEFDPQKGEISPRNLFNKRKLDKIEKKNEGAEDKLEEHYTKGIYNFN